MTKFAIALLMLVAIFALAACGETYDPINDTKLVVVRDDGGANGVDARNIRVACAEAGYASLKRVVGRVHGDKPLALVECQ